MTNHTASLTGHTDWPEGGPDRSLIIGMAGGSGSGKTTIAQAVVDTIGPAAVTLIEHDSYYRDLSHMTLAERAKQNFDHPDSLETELLVEHLEVLRKGDAVDIPTYDFATHTRRVETVRVHPHRVVVVEGILVLSEPSLRALMDLKIYVDTDPDLRLIRRLSRDINERGRSVDSVLDQYLTTVRPMHLQFVEPNKRYADMIIPEGYNVGAVATVVSLIRDYAGGVS